MVSITRPCPKSCPKLSMCHSSKTELLVQPLNQLFEWSVWYYITGNMQSILISSRTMLWAICLVREDLQKAYAIIITQNPIKDSFSNYYHMCVGAALYCKVILDIRIICFILWVPHC